MKPALLVIWLVALPPTLAAQAVPRWLPIPPKPAFADSIPTAKDAPLRMTVQDAEAEGANWVHRSEPSFQPADRGAADFATASPRKCVTANSIGPLRSGEFVIGGNLAGDPSMNGTVKIWWRPMHPAEGFSLVVRGVSLEASKDTLRYLNPGWAISGSPREGALGPIFYASGLTFPSKGRWLVIATSGPDSGCFILRSD